MYMYFNSFIIILFHHISNYFRLLLYHVWVLFHFLVIRWSLPVSGKVFID